VPEDMALHKPDGGQTQALTGRSGYVLDRFPRQIRHTNGPTQRLPAILRLTGSPGTTTTDSAIQQHVQFAHIGGRIVVLSMPSGSVATACLMSARHWQEYLST